MTTTALTPASVSALLRRNGLNPLGAEAPRTREGIRVKRAAVGDTVTVVIDVDSPTVEAQLTADATAICREAGYLVAVNPHTSSIFYVARTAPAPTPGVLGQFCPTCGAHPGQGCTSLRDGYSTLHDFHAARPDGYDDTDH